MDNLTFDICLIEDAIFSVCKSSLSSFKIDLFEPLYSKFLGYLAVSSSPKIDITNQKLSTLPAKRKMDTGASFFAKSKAAKPLIGSSSPKIQHVKPGEVSQSMVDSSQTAQPGRLNFQQDANDLVTAMQSLETGQKVFSCKMCGLQGKQKNNVLRHVVLKHMQGLKQNFRCIVCEKEFSLKHHLKGHLIKSHGMNEERAKAAIAL